MVGTKISVGRTLVHELIRCMDRKDERSSLFLILDHLDEWNDEMVRDFVPVYAT